MALQLDNIQRFTPPFWGWLGGFSFRETLLLRFCNFLCMIILAFLTIASAPVRSGPHEGGFHESRQEVAVNQPELLHGEHVTSRVNYQGLFSLLPEIQTSNSQGRPPVNPNVMLRAFIYADLRELRTLSGLRSALTENPSVAEATGLPACTAIPSVNRFSNWLRNIENEELQRVRRKLVAALVAKGALKGKTIALDSAPVPSPVRENNLKTTMADRFNKEHPPEADSDAGLGVYRVYPGSGTQKIRYFWGYRNHVAADFETELPICEITAPANQHETRFAVPLLHACNKQFSLVTETVCADSAYDSEKLLGYIIETLEASPIIAPNNRYQPNTDFRHRGKDILCPAGLKMVHKGRMTPKRTGITYRQYCCPLHYSKKEQQKHLICPADHPKFYSGKGCNHLVRLTPSYRSQIAYGSDRFVEEYNKRTVVERVFSRLLALAMQKPTVRGFASIENHCTIAHITVLLVANAAYDSGHPDKMAFVTTFVPKFMTSKI